MAAEHPTPVIHARTEPLRDVLKALDAAPAYAKLPYARELSSRTLTLLAELCHELDTARDRIAALERFPEVRA